MTWCRWAIRLFCLGIICFPGNLLWLRAIKSPNFQKKEKHWNILVLVVKWCHRANGPFQNWQSNVHIPWPNELTICPAINGFRIPVKTLSTGHRWRKTKEFFVCLVSGTINLATSLPCPWRKCNKCKKSLWNSNWILQSQNHQCTKR